MTEDRVAIGRETTATTGPAGGPGRQIDDSGDLTGER